MARSSKYAIARLNAHPIRGERLNIGLLIFAENSLDIRIGRRLDKVRAISAALDPTELRERLLELANIDALLRDEGLTEGNDRRDALNDLGFVDLSETAEIDSSNTAVYESMVQSLMVSMIEPEQAKTKAPPKRTRLLSVVKGALKRERILAREGDDLAQHRVVPNVQLAEGLVADLVLKNGSMHVVETIDASAADISPRKIVTDIALSALVLEQARISYGNGQTKAKLIYDASASVEAIAMPSLKAAAHQGADLINWQSRDDQLRFLTHLSSLATPFETKRVAGKTRFIASTQRKLDLN
ncbi:DUF3037 domain-containing protein [Sphingobium yanoikuyae]|uniref:DUF3037 domain-containing protein n=1 Tax=Sphingobium yanoikuyae TaxID=13690 RepID=UPI0028A17F83|nr:DUF3037 domain-containing protein [Sphingobium yanoikuyae]